MRFIIKYSRGRSGHSVFIYWLLATGYCLLALSICALTGSADAQSTPAQNPPPALTPELEALNSLPASDSVVVINLRRILTEALPHVMPAGKVSEMESFFNTMKLLSNVDLRQIDSIVCGVQVPKSISARMLPEVSIVVHGSFASDQVIEAFKHLPSARSREEQYRGSTIYIFDLDQILDPPSASVFINPKEMALTALNTNTIAIGNLANVHRTIEASAGHGRISLALVTLATRNPKALISFAVIDSKHKEPDIISTSMQSADEIIQALNSITQLYASLEMSETSFEFLMFARTAHPKQTIPLRDVIISLLHQLNGLVKDARAKNILDNLQIKMHSDEVHVITRIPNAAIASFIQEMQSPPPKPSVPTSIEKSSPGKRRTPRRRMHQH